MTGLYRIRNGQVIATQTVRGDEFERVAPGAVAEQEMPFVDVDGNIGENGTTDEDKTKEAGA